MPKKPQTKGRTQVIDLPKKGKKLSAGELKKVRGGSYEMSKSDGITAKNPKPKSILGTNNDPFGT